jgi:hypothetical protein
MSEITLKVTVVEAVTIVNLIGSLPTNQNAHGLWEKLKAQVQPELEHFEKLTAETPAE